MLGPVPEPTPPAAPLAPAPAAATAPPDFVQELDTLVRARYPLVWLVTSEEQRLEALLGELAARHGKALLALPGLAALREKAPARFDDTVRDALLELLYASGSDIVLLPFQDLFGHRERVNVPGTVTEQNWTYRMTSTLSRLIADGESRRRLRSLAERHGRAGRH